MRAIVAAACLLALAADAPPALTERTSKDGRYRVLMFDKAREEVRLAPGKVRMHMLWVELPDGAVAVTYADLPVGEKEPASRAEKRLDGSRDALLGVTRAKLKSEKKLSLAEAHPGRDITAELPGDAGRLRARLYLVGRRLYQLQALGKPAFVDGPDVEKFFDSFRLVP
jgi:hypothetical protein